MTAAGRESLTDRVLQVQPLVSAALGRSTRERPAGQALEWRHLDGSERRAAGASDVPAEPKDVPSVDREPESRELAQFPADALTSEPGPEATREADVAR